jgi:hypothetical protein
MTESKGMLKLTADNYEVWRVLMEAVFTRKNVLDVAVGTTLRPTTGPSSKAVKDWDRKSAEARAEMILAVEIDQLAHMTAPTAPEVWEELERVHRSRGFATKMGSSCSGRVGFQRTVRRGGRRGQAKARAREPEPRTATMVALASFSGINLPRRSAQPMHIGEFLRITAAPQVVS